MGVQNWSEGPNLERRERKPMRLLEDLSIGLPARNGGGNTQPLMAHEPIGGWTGRTNLKINFSLHLIYNTTLLKLKLT